MKKLAQILSILFASLLWVPSIQAEPSEAETEKSLEGDIDAAKAKVKAHKDSKESTEVEAGTAEQEVTPVEEKKEERSPLSFGVSVSHSVGTGTFVANDYVREQADYVGQSWGISASYRFKLFEKSLSASARTGLGIQLTTPTGNPARRWNPRDTSLGLSMGSIYKDETTGINLSGGLGMSFPTSFGSIYATKKIVGLSSRLGLSRSFKTPAGSIGLSYSLSFGKGFFGSLIRTRHVSVMRMTDDCTASDTDAPFECAMGGANTNWSLSNGLSLSYKPTDHLSFGYSVGYGYSEKFAIVDERDMYTAEQADVGPGNGDSFNTGLSMSFALSQALAGVVDLPFGLSTSAGISTGHPTKTADNKEILWPIFVNSFGNNRAANNYGSIYFDLSGNF